VGAQSTFGEDRAQRRTMRLTPRRYDAPRRARRALFFRFCRPKKPKTRAVPDRDCRKKSRISPLRLPPQLAR
jgi:hypothetical protein